ncbi:hypothetical protein HBI56_233440 [Parastagonospora nodorum]|uniref:Uncharacterized protein n=1 Tax=Phaeosphaeria nodorum (strain SN15 / ATCC MYA-4574 / FGSC 10173) TaxID=321614 RepID=A0A7U2I8J9_PHANO|nr:hypothetical protein HBH56_114150 [Parastagonospora nodorum]QRD04938.1 hypothetical protein JI435_108580 [Parastagonospora nodorum SN15]KAH3928719.1 hypothetical protein HBH54_135010 [Parastagonospora nodorum]KAH3950819.1 hypothetical protein HBH53_075290 [Parastagonospora nodorum]KAH3958443.1 hypothetical protein HBH52_251030 [Parastagonospora nodorum]
MNSFSNFDLSSWVTDHFGNLVTSPPTPQPTPPAAKRGPGRPRTNPLPDPNVPRRSRGRPSGAKDTFKRIGRNQKAILSKEERLERNRTQQRASLKRTREAQNLTPPSSHEVQDLTLSEDEQSEATPISSPNAAWEDELLREFFSLRSPPPPTHPHHISPEEASLTPADFAALNNGLSGATYTNPFSSSLAFQDDTELEEDLTVLYSWSS